MRKTISLVLAVLMMLVLLPAVKLSPAVAEDATVTDELTGAWTGVSGNSYADWSGKTSNSDAVYAGQSAGQYDSIQLRSKNNNSGVITTASGGTFQKIVLTWNSNTYGTRVLDVYGKDTAYASPTDLYDSAKCGTLIGSLTYVQDGEIETTLTAEAEYAYIGFRSHDSALYLDKVEITWATGATPSTEPSTEPEPSPDPEPETTAMELVTELKSGDEVVIFNAANSKVMTGEEYYYENTSNQSKSKWEIVAADATLTDDVLAVPEAAVVLTVEILVPDTEDPETRSIDEEPNVYAFKTADGKYLYADNKHTRFVERDEENAENTFFQLEPVEGGFYIKCNSATFNDKAQYIEYYKNYFTVYSMGTDASIYTFQFYAEPGETPEPPIVEPTGDTIVLFTNDVHCGIRDGWGYAGVADLKKSLEAEGNEVILVDAGDHVQGGPIGSLTQGEAIIDIMNFVGYDLATLGNHEFDYGMDQMFALVEQAEYPYVSANFVKVEGNEPVFDAYKIFEANGKKIAFVGLSTPESITKSTPTYFMNEAGEYIYGFCQDDTGAGVYTAAQNAIDAAKAEGADYVIIVGHMGIDEQSQPWTAPEVIANVTGADAFIDGHSHSVINTTVKDKEGNDVLHGQTGTKLANVGKLTIAADGTLTMELLPASEKVQDDPETDEYIKSIEDEFEALLNTVVAYTDHILTIKDPDTGARAVRNAETNLGDLCADAYRYMFDSDIAFVNGGGVRADIAEGDITFQQIINVHPFGNTAVLAEVTGQQILDALEMGARVCPGENGGFLQVAGMKYEIHTYVEPNCVVGSDKMWAGPVDPEGEYRVKNVQILNKETNEYEPLDLEKKYTLASHNYMLKDMGDGFAMFGPNITILEDSGKLDNQVLIDYIQSMPEVDGKHVVEGYTDPKGEGRINVVTTKTATIYGEDLLAADVFEETEDGTLYRYDVRIKDVDPEIMVVGMQTFVQYDKEALTFVEAKSALEGNTGVNEENGVVSFAWACKDDGITVEDGTVIVSIYFKLNKPAAEGTVLTFSFVPAANGATTGYSYISGSTVVEADEVNLTDGSITFAVPGKLTILGEDVLSTDVMVVEDGELLYRYNLRVADLPRNGLEVNSVQIFLSCDSILEFRKAEGMFDWTIGQKDGKLMFVWASETPVLLNNDDIILSIYFAAPKANGETANIVFTTNALNTVSSMSFEYEGKVYEIEADTVDGSIRFVEIMLGDANCDGSVTAADAALVLRYLVGLNDLSAQGMINADVDGDLAVTAEDAAIILRYVVKLIDKFPAEE